MTAPGPQRYAAFRLNLEQQKKRAKDLLKAEKSGDPVARSRLTRVHGDSISSIVPSKLADAQRCIARELRFASWAALKAHIAAMEAARVQVGAPLDGDLPTMHVRCGDDLRETLREAGFAGTFCRHINPYLQGPVTDAPDWLEQRARFIAEGLTGDAVLDYPRVLEACREEERMLERAARDYARVVLWLEHDRYDQFVLVRCLAAFAEHGRPSRLELVGPNDFPGADRFLGLGQLPPEALKLLWHARWPLGRKHLAFGHEVWDAFRSPDPRRLAELARAGTPLLPDLANALRRHLSELPSAGDGLGLTHRLLLEALDERGPSSVGQIVGLVMRERDPLPGLGDTGYDRLLRELASGPEPLVERAAAGTWHLDTVSLTAHGRAVLAGDDWLASAAPERWVGGVRIAPGQANWRRDERAGRLERR